MPTHWLFAFVTILGLSSLSAAQQAPPAVEGPTLGAAAAVPSRSTVPPPPVPDAGDVPAELLPPGRVVSRPVENPVAPMTPPRIRLPEHPLAVVDVVVLTHNQIGDDTILRLLRQYGVERPLLASDVMALHNEGVSNTVIKAMQESPRVAPAAVPTYTPPPPVAAPAPVIVYPRPVVVQEYRYVVPPPVRYYYGPPRPYHGPRWGITIYGR